MTDSGGGGGVFVGFFMILAAAYMIASIVLQAMILSNGMDGNYVRVPERPRGEQIGEQAYEEATARFWGRRRRRDQSVFNPAGLSDPDVTNPASAEGMEGASDRYSPPEETDVSSESTVGGSPPETDGVCQIDVEFQGEGNYLRDGCGEVIGATPTDTNQLRYDLGCFPVGVTPWHPESNIFLTYPDPSQCSVAVSPTWTVAGWNHTFVQLAPGATFHPPTPTEGEMMAVKLLRGTLIDVNANGVLRDDGHWETYVVTPPNRAASLWLDASVADILAGDGGAAFLFFKVPQSYINLAITDMTVSPAIDNSGPYSEFLQWTRFGDYYSTFGGVEFYNYCGIILQNSDGSRLAAFQWWTFREDEDADGYHDHSNMNSANTFAELHMNMYASSGTSGMQTTLPDTQNSRTVPNPQFGVEAEDRHKYNRNDQTEVQISIPLPPGYVHGPLWSVNATNGEPNVGCDGGVLYPYHRWLGGSGEGNSGFNNPPRYSMWIALEHSPQYATVPMTMISNWVNAYLESSITNLNCAE